MKYFITEAARGASGSTAYFEFQKGRYGGECWKKDSLCISAGRWDALSLTELLAQVFPAFDCYGVTIVCRGQWERVRRLARAVPEWEQAMGELDAWADACFEKQEAFSILGI
ncbi:hypothetical protein AALG83_08290 [Christensenellaceae bacterium 44-20]